MTDAIDELLKLGVDELLDAFASGEPVPGGGSAAAIVVAAGASLVEKAARRSVDSWAEAAGAAAQAHSLRLRAAPLAVSDARAYRDALGRLGRREGYDHLLGAALEEAAAVPLLIARAGADVASLAREVADRCDPAIRPDAVGAGLLAAAGAAAAAHLVEVNLAATGDDPRVLEANACAEAALGSAYGRP